MDANTKNKFSRQIGAVGRHTMEKLMNIKVLLIGGDIMGMEVTKCLSLIGIKELYILDNDKLTKKKKNNLYFSSDTSKTLSENLIDFAKELNPSLITHKISKIDFEDIKKKNINAIVMTKVGNYNLINIDNVCSKENIKFILGLNYELEGYIFSNFGKHCIIDKDGEPCVSGYIEDYSVKDDEIIITVEKLDNNLISSNGKLISGKKEFNIKVKSSSLTEIKVNKSDNLIEFLKNNNVKFLETKETIYKNYKPFTEKSNDYSYLSDTTSFATDDKQITEFIKNITGNNTINKDFRKKQDFSILSSIIAGIISHEVIKITGKYTPIDQQIYFNYESLRGSNFYRSSNTRNSAFLDRDLIRKIKKTNVFMVGCGALGCEISKNMGMIEMSSNVNSRFTITDMDIIEQSNLTRQFLFRNNDIGKSKSSIVKEKLKEYCPIMNITEYNTEVGENTIDTFNSAFWNNCDLVIGALDNIPARKYVDSKCVEFDLPLFDSGTLGTKCNTQTIIPNKTATYSELSDQEEKTIPMCTIKTFPNKIEHCIEWALDIFHTYLSVPIQDINKLISAPEQLEEEFLTIDNQYNRKLRIDNLIKYANIFNLDKTTTKLDEFFLLIIYIIENVFINPIKDILNTFPDDLTNESGSLFWSGKKLKPSVLKIDDFPICFAESIYNILSSSMKLPIWSNEEYTDFIKNYKPSEYISKKLNINEKKDIVKEDISECEIIDRRKIKESIQLAIKIIGNETQKEINIIEYDKDDNIMLDGMTNLSNLRASIYGIDVVDSLDIKLISGKIIPALSTTTTVVSGFVTLEIIKYLNEQITFKHTPSDINVNLGTNQYILFDSLKPESTYDNMFSKAYGMPVRTMPYMFNTWDKIKISSTKECCPDTNELVSILQSDYKINVSMITYGSKIIYENTNTQNKSIFELFNELNVPRCENIKLSMYAYDNSGIPILTPPLFVEN